MNPPGEKQQKTFWPVEPNGTHIRWVTRPDLPQLVALEQRCFSAAQSRWGAEQFRRAFAHPRGLGKVVSDVDERILGYLVYRLDRRRFWVLNLAVDPAARRRGIGTRLVQTLTERLSARRPRLEVAVWERNLAAQLFFRAAGLRCVKTARSYFTSDSGQEEDAYVFRRELSLDDVFRRHPGPARELLQRYRQEFEASWRTILAAAVAQRGGALDPAGQAAVERAMLGALDEIFASPAAFVATDLDSPDFRERFLQSVQATFTAAGLSSGLPPKSQE